MVRLWSRLLMLTAVMVGAASTVTAQDLADVLGRSVTAVHFVVEGREDISPALMSLADVRVGQPLRQEDVRSTLGRLDSLGRYDDIVPVATVVGDGVEVTFRLTPRHPVTNIDVRGDAGLPAGTLRSLILQRYGGVPTTTRPSAVADTAAQLLRDEGYLRARVTPETVISHDPEGATLALTVEAGPQAHIGRTEIRGTSPLTTAEILQRTKTQAGLPFKRRDVETGITALEDDLRGRGYYEAQVTLLPPSAGETVDPVINIDTGPLVELKVVPDGVLSRGDVDTLVPIKRLGAVDQDLLEDSRARVERALRAEGYWRAKAPFTREPSADGKRLTVVFTIDRGPRYFIDRIEWPSSSAVPELTLRELVAVRDGEVFDQDRFLAGMARVADLYRRSGYYQFKAEPGFDEAPDPNSTNSNRALVVVHPNMTEGPRGQVAAETFVFSGPHRVPEGELRQAMSQHVGRPYVELEAAQDRAALRTLYRNRGYLQAFVEIVPSFSEDGTDVSVTVTINEGPQVRIGQISVVGNRAVSEAYILREMHLVAGQPAGDAALAQARRRLAEMGFRRVTISTTPGATEQEVRVIVSVTEAPRISLAYGGGLEGGRQLRRAVGGGFEDYLGFAPRGSFEIGRRNLGGRNRSLNLYSRVSFKRRRSQDPELDGRGFGFTEYRVTGTYQEHRAFGADVDLIIGTSFEQAVRTNFNFLRKSTNVEALRRVTDHLNVSGRYVLDFTRLFDELIADDDPLQPLIDRLFPQVRLSYLASGVSWDRRDSPLAPTRGSLAAADVELAMRAIGSQVGYSKVFLQGSMFHALDSTKKTIVAGRAELGLAHGLPRAVTRVDADGNPVPGDNGQPIVDLIHDLPASQRFFAGGSTTVRGFQLDRLGVPEILTKDGLSIGGNAVVVLNGEIRRSIAKLAGRTVAAVAFVDGGNVFATASTVDFTRLRGAAGFGVRYDSPLGPIRLDFGFKMKPEIVGGNRERRWEYHLSIGEAF
ncbi:MAG: POTRA domain-containing protein [Acidobacteriota bacterium]